MRTTDLSFKEDFLFSFHLDDLKERALAGDGISFYVLFERAFYGDLDAVEAFHGVVTSHLDHFCRFAQFFSHPQLYNVAFQVLRHPHFDLTALEPWVAETPFLLILLGGLALKEDHNPAREMLFRSKLNQKIYQEAVEENHDYIAFLSLIAEAGYPNVQDLLNQLVSRASPSVLLAFLGVAAQGSPAALQALEEGITSSQSGMISRLVRDYGDHPIFGAFLERWAEKPSPVSNISIFPFH